MTPPPESLPVEASIAPLRAALGEQRHAVLQAPTGAGKTTIVPLRLLAEPWLDGRRILMLEPRRIAARAAARRMSALLGEDVGGTVGYRTRDERRVGPTTRIEVVTEGILTRRLQRDPTAGDTGLVIFDEFHERSVHADLGLALALDVRRHLRDDLRLLVMSATLDGDRVAALLGTTAPAGDHGPAPVITSEGRAFPVEIIHRPPPPRARLEPAVADAVSAALRTVDGDILVFLPGAAEIGRTARLLIDAGVDAEIRPLYGAIPAAEQDAAIEPSPPGSRKVVLATDIAETSLTVEGVRCVVDAGLARVPQFDAATGMTRLRTVPASRASADQRAGRAGRTAPGTAYRLWSKIEHGARRRFSDPEISQVDLAGLALEVAAWGSAGSDLPFLDPPPSRSLEEGQALLRSLGALDDSGAVTVHGRAMLELPVHPRLARLVIAARESAIDGDPWLGCVLAALLDDRDVLRGRPDELPADIAVRVSVVLGLADRAGVDGRAARARHARAVELARRAGIAQHGAADPGRTGSLLAFAYPDRVAARRDRTPGRFQLRGGGTAVVAGTDALATEEFIVVADLDGHRKEARIRQAAAVDRSDVEAAFGEHIVEHEDLVWDRERDELVARVERRLGRIALGTIDRRPAPGPATARMLAARLRATRLELLPWTAAARRLQHRLVFAHSVGGEGWPDASDEILARDVGDWLAPELASASGMDDVRAIDVHAALRRLVPPGQHRALDDLAPSAVTLPNGRRIDVDYSDGAPTVAAPVQWFFGVTETPAVGRGTVPVVVHLLSPAGRPVQITSDLAGFWSGSWSSVRREYAGRYPKHPWPEHPTAADHPRR